MTGEPPPARHVLPNKRNRQESHHSAACPANWIHVNLPPTMTVTLIWKSCC